MTDRLTCPPPLFDADSTGGDAYQRCRNHLTKEEARASLERAWQRVSQFCPEGPVEFARQFRQDFHARAWELFLLDVLTQAGLKVEPPVKRGPDIGVRLPSGTRCWIEAVTPTPGQGDNAVFQPPPGYRGGAVPKDTNIILRYTQALEEKVRTLTGWKDAGIVGPDDAYLIAVSQGAIENSDLHDDDIPALVRATLGVGETVMKIVPYSAQPPTVETVSREEVRKRNGAPVATTSFLEPRTEFVSGILFARHAVWALTRPWSAATSLGLIHRPHAKNPVPLGEIPMLCELWAEPDGNLKHRGRCAMFGRYSRDEGAAP